MAHSRWKCVCPAGALSWPAATQQWATTHLQNCHWTSRKFSRFSTGIWEWQMLQGAMPCCHGFTMGNIFTPLAPVSSLWHKTVASLYCPGAPYKPKRAWGALEACWLLRARVTMGAVLPPADGAQPPFHCHERTEINWLWKKQKNSARPAFQKKKKSFRALGILEFFICFLRVYTRPCIS